MSFFSFSSAFPFQIWLDGRLIFALFGVRGYGKLDAVRCIITRHASHELYYSFQQVCLALVSCVMALMNL